MDWLDNLTGGHQLGAASILFLAAIALALTIRLRLAWSTQRFIAGLGHDLAVAIQDRVLHQPYEFHIRQNSSRIVASLEKVQIFVSGVLLQGVQAASAVVIGIFIIVALVIIEPFAATVSALAFGACYLLISRVTGPLLARSSSIFNHAYDRRVQIVQESLGGIRDVIVDGSQSVYLDEFRSIDRQFADVKQISAFLTSAPRLLMEGVAVAVLVGVAMLVSTRAQGLSGTLPVLGALALGAMRLLPLLQQFYQAWTVVAANKSIAVEVSELLALPNLKDETPADPLPFKHTMRLDQVTFAYPGRSRAAIKDLNLMIPHGARVAIIGKTGSGKSTLVDMLMGLLSPSEGRILIDDVALDDRTRRSWQRTVAHVPQSIFLADTTIARNIALGDLAHRMDLERVTAAARIAQLDDMIAGLPEGLETIVGERGVSLSGGQRQRLGLARAIYKDSPVLLLDEATNALDQETEAAVLHALAELHALGRTIIMISHRHGWLHDCDLLVTIDGGRIVAIEQPEKQKIHH